MSPVLHGTINIECLKISLCIPLKVISGRKYFLLKISSICIHFLENCIIKTTSSYVIDFARLCNLPCMITCVTPVLGVPVAGFRAIISFPRGCDAFLFCHEEYTHFYENHRK